MKVDPNNANSFSAKARAERVKWFADCCKKNNVKNAHVLDIGGTLDFWKMNHRYIGDGVVAEIDVVNLPPIADRTEMIAGTTINIYGGDALDRESLRQKRYDIVFSNSVIEHVGNLNSQREMAQIIKQIGDYYWVQTPAKSFPIEPHFYFPFFPYLPLNVRTFLHQKMRLGFMTRQPDWLSARISCEETRLLTHKEVSSLFDNSVILKEKVLFLNKSYIATNMISPG